MTGLRLRKMEHTRNEIRAAALRLVMERGFDAVTVDDIAAAAQVGRRTFFRYFSAKEEPLLDDSGLAQLLTELLDARAPGESPVLAVRDALLQLAHHLDAGDRAAELARLRLVLTTPALRARSLGRQADWEAIIGSWLARRSPDVSPLDRRLLPALCVAAMRAGIETWVSGDGSAEVEELLETAFDRLLPAFVAPAEVPG